MLNLAEYRKKPQSLADFLPWAALVAPVIVLNKDGSFQRTARFRGPDLDSATEAELVGATARLNNALRRLGSGWAILVEAQRNPAQHYPVSRFPDPVSALVDEERKAQFEEEGARFESGYFLTLVYLPPEDDAAGTESWFYEGRASGDSSRATLSGFIDRTDRLLQLVEGFAPEAEWIAAILARENISITPEVKEHLWTALGSLASAPVAERTLTGLSVLLQSNALKRALKPFCLGGPHGRLLDAEVEVLGAADIQTFETEGLIRSSAAPAVLAYLFHRIEGQLDGSPSLIIIDEV